MEPLPQSVLVGVTGAGENTEALRFAVTEARRHGCGLTLVHVVHQLLLPPPPSVLITHDTWSEIGDLVVADVRREAEELIGDDQVPLATVVRHGDAGVAFADLSKNARVIVLQHRDLARLHRIVSGSTVAAVAFRSWCPVVSVPAVQEARPPSGVVAAGVHVDGGPWQVLEAAFAEAAERRASLHLVHGWKLPAAYDDAIVHEIDGGKDDAGITTATADLRSKYPDVEVRVDVRHDWPADVLVEAAQSADLLVVGRHSGLPLMPSRVGSLARTAIAHAACPVMVVPL